MIHNLLWSGALMHNLLLLPATGLVDAPQLAAHGDSAHVPMVVMWAVAWEESRSGQRGNSVLGPGLYRNGLRVCREQGRMQVNPCMRWDRLFPRCAMAKLSYDHNVACAARILRHHYDTLHSWEEAIRAYNGNGPRARAYRERALSYVGRVVLRVEWAATTGT